MPLLAIRMVVTHEVTGDESILAKVEADDYSPDLLDTLVNACLSKSLEEIKGTSLQALKSWSPEVSVVLTTDDDESVRPSLHLNAGTLQRLAEAGASFDFDPYV